MDLGGSDKFAEAGFGDYISFKKEINAVAEDLLKNFNNVKKFRPFEAKLNSISAGLCITDLATLYTILGKPSDMKDDIDKGKYTEPQYKQKLNIVLRKLNEAKTYCPVWKDPGPDVNPLTATSGLGPKMTASDSSSSSSSSSKAARKAARRAASSASSSASSASSSSSKGPILVDPRAASSLEPQIIIKMNYDKVDITNKDSKKIYIYTGNWCKAILSNLKELILLLQITSSKINNGLPNYTGIKWYITTKINELFNKLNSCSDKYEPPNPDGTHKITLPPSPPSFPDFSLSKYDPINKRYDKIKDDNSGIPFTPDYYKWYDKISHETIARFKIRANGRSDLFPGDLFICLRNWEYRYEVPEFGDGLPDTWIVRGLLYDYFEFMRVPEAEFRRRIEEKLGEEQLLTSEQIMMYNISTKTGESSLFPEYTFKVGYENGYYRLTITKKPEKVCGRIPEKAHLPPDIRSLKTGKSKTYTQALMWKLFKCENVVEYDGGLLFVGYSDYTIKYNPVSDDYTITKL
jgi:hypothetical protein